MTDSAPRAARKEKTMTLITFATRQGHSGVDHFLPEIVRHVTERVNEEITSSTIEDPAMIRKAIRAHLRRTLSQSGPNAERTYRSYGLSETSFDADRYRFRYFSGKEVNHGM
jgi:hypothetical protein